MSPLLDSFGRQFSYLRLSITDVCNFRCMYCLPNGYQKSSEMNAPLSVDEVENLVRGFAALGFWKIRLTGGEPTTRRDFIDIAQRVANVNGIKTVGLSTNGYRLKEVVEDLRLAGVNALNVSIDSLDPQSFQRITGSPRLKPILEGIERAVDIGIESIKLNVVLLKGLNDQELSRFADYVRTRPIAIRFIELMRTGKNADLFAKHHVSGEVVKTFLREKGWSERERREGDGPAVEFRNSEYLGRLGVIAPYSKDFCNTCNRLRVSSQGNLRLCLFGEGDSSLRPWLQSPDQLEDLTARIRKLIERKPATHYLHEGRYGNTWNLASIGG